MTNEIEMLTEAEAVTDVESEVADPTVEQSDQAENTESVAESVSDVPSDSEPEPENNELADLRDQISSLRAELESRDRALARMHDEISEFSELYPDRTLTALPTEVWDGVRSGLPLAASVALYEARCRRREALADEINRRNSAASSGSVDGADVDYYSPDEVRAMNAAQVRQNYSKILDSMKLWS